MQLKVAGHSEIDAVLELHRRYQKDTMAEEDKADGFITTAFTREELAALVDKEQGLFVAERDGRVVAYVMSASWEFWSAWPMFAHMVTDLPNRAFHGRVLDTANSYQYGPVCVDKDLRGSGALEKLFAFAREKMSGRYPILVTFVNKINARSYEAHRRKLGLEVIHEFEYNGNQYYEMAGFTAPSA